MPKYGPEVKTVVLHIAIDDQAIDTQGVFTIIEPVWWIANIYDDELTYYNSLAEFTQAQRYLHAIYWHLAEVNNGGHDQFYFNSTGIVWKLALLGYREVGLEECASILQESAVRMGGSPSLDRAERQKELDLFTPDFSDLDTRFYKLQEIVDFDVVMKKYILAHRSDFYFDGDVVKPAKRL